MLFFVISFFFFFFFFFNDTATTEIYTLSLHDALPICSRSPPAAIRRRPRAASLAASYGQRLLVAQREPAAHQAVDDPDRQRKQAEQTHRDAYDGQHDEPRQACPQHREPEGPQLPAEMRLEEATVRRRAAHVVHDHRDDRRQAADETADDGVEGGDADEHRQRVQRLHHVGVADERLVDRGCGGGHLRIRV